jgi:hypothetical protein
MTNIGEKAKTAGAAILNPDAVIPVAAGIIFTVGTIYALLKGEFTLAGVGVALDLLAYSEAKPSIVDKYRYHRDAIRPRGQTNALTC